MTGVTIQDEPSSLFARIEQYGIDPDTSEGLRERLAGGLVYPGSPAARRLMEEPQVKVEGEWQPL